MTEQERLEILRKHGAIITGSHIVYTSGRHGADYINKDMVSLHTDDLSELCGDIAAHFSKDNIHVVVAPAVGAIAMAQWVANHLTFMSKHEVSAVYAEKAEQSLVDAEGDLLLLASYTEYPPKADSQVVPLESKKLGKGDSLVIKSNKFVIKRGFASYVNGKNALVVEDVLTTGGSALGVVKAVREAGGDIIGLGVLCNRGGVTCLDVDVPKLFALVNVAMESCPPDECNLCKGHVPINLEVGKGREYVAKHGQP